MDAEIEQARTTFLESHGLVQRVTAVLVFHPALDNDGRKLRRLRPPPSIEPTP